MLDAIFLVAALILRSNSCVNIEIQVGTCEVTASVGNGEATLDGYVSTPGDSSGPGDGSLPDSGAAVPAPIACQTLTDGSCVRDTFTVTAPVTLADIAAFRPDQPSSSMEPSGWAVVGLPANFFSSAASEVQAGTLLAQSASVRFTPVMWVWSYGDGTSATLSTPGASWGSLAVGEFDETPTSHTFRVPGKFTTSLTVHYSAEYRLGGLDWTEISGTVPVTANDLAVVVGDTRTVLVSRDCRHPQRGPGC